MITRPECQKHLTPPLQISTYECRKFQVSNSKHSRLLASDRNIDTNLTAILFWTNQRSSDTLYLAASRHVCILFVYGLTTNSRLWQVTNICVQCSIMAPSNALHPLYPAPDGITRAWITEPYRSDIMINCSKNIMSFTFVILAFAFNQLLCV